MRRWFIRILLGLAALIVLVVVVVQIVLWTNIPKNLVLRQIERELDLRISADSLTTGWLGRSTLSNVDLGLPLSEESFLKLKVLQVKHTTLIGLLLGRSISIERIEIDEPHVFVRQGASGQWNLQEVIEILARAGGGKTAADSDKAGVPKLPEVKLVNGSVEVIDNRNHHATLAPLNVDGRSEDALTWKYDVKVAQSIALIGQVAPGGSWKHQVRLTAHDLDSLLKDWGVDSYNAEMRGDWQGMVTDDGNVTGTLTLDHATAKGVPFTGNIQCAGAVDVETTKGTVTLRPKRIDFKTSNPTLPNVGITAGDIVKDNSGVRAQALEVEALGGLAVLDAAFDPRTMVGDLQARWSGLSLSSNMNHSGSITASLRMPFAGQPLIKIDALSQGGTSSSKWDARVDISGKGQSWKSIDWVITAPTLAYTGGRRPIEFAQLVGHVSQRWPSIELTDLSLAERPHLQSKAAANLATGEWYFWLDAGGVQSTHNMPVPINLSINLWGDRTHYTLHEFTLRGANASFWATGIYDTAKPNPVDLDVFLIQSPQLAATAPFQGHVDGQLKITGALFKESDDRFHPQLGIAGHMTSSDLVVLDRPVGDFDVQLIGFVDDTDTKIQTTEMRLFQGKWKLSANYPTSHGGIALKVDVHDLPIDQLAAFARMQNITGQMTEGSWRFEIPRSGELDQISLDSSYVVRDLDANGFKVDRIEGDATLDAGVLKLAPLAATTGTGRADAAVTYDLTNPGHILTEAKLDKWPWGTPGGAEVKVTGDTRLDIDLQHRSASGPLAANVDLQFNKTPLAHADLTADLRERTLTVQKLAGTALAGTFDGTATVDIDKPLQALGNVRWKDVDAGALATISPSLGGLGGKFSGTIAIGPARDPRPLAPVRIDMNIATEDGHYRAVRIGDPSSVVAIHAVAYADSDRAVLDHSDIHIAGGVAHLWARTGRGLASQAVELDFDRLQLDQVAHVMSQLNGKPVPGLLAGRLSMVGSGLDTNKLLGQGRIELTQADLGNVGPITFLYNAMNASKSSAPSGSGSLDLRLEQNALHVTGFRYFNRGVDTWGIFTLGPNIWNVPNTPVNGQLAGSFRTLKGTRIPFLADFDQVFAVLQGTLTTMVVNGPDLDHPNPQSIAVAQIGTDLRKMLVGDARAQSGQ